MAVLYTTEKTVEMIRTRIADTAEPYLISDDQIAEALDEAQRQLVEHTLCLRDATSFVIPVVAGTEWYTLDDEIMSIREGYLVISRKAVRPVTSVELMSLTGSPDYGVLRSTWREATGTPEFMVTDLQNDKIRLVPIPVVSENLELEVHVRPRPIVDTDSALSIPDRLRPYLVAGVLSRLYLIQDAELYDPKSAERWQAQWLGGLAEARNMIERDTRGPGVVRMGRNGVWG